MIVLWRASELTGYSVRASDGSVGSVSDLLFDDIGWTVRWAVIDTGTWLSGRQVLLPPSVLERPDHAGREFPVGLARTQIEQSPDIGTDAPVSRQMETDLYGYYGWTPYWYPTYVPPGFGAAGPVPPIGGPAGPVPPPSADTRRTGPGAAGELSGDPDLRSASEVTGYYVRASDDDIGHIEEFLVEDGSWAIRYLVIDTKNWWPGKMVLVSPQSIREVSWGEQQVRVDLTRDQVKNSPEYDPASMLDRDQFKGPYTIFDYPPNWS